MIADAQFNRTTLDCMTMLKRRIKQVMGVTVRLAAPDAVEQMIDLSKACQDDEVRELGVRLAGMLGSHTPADQPAAASNTSATRPGASVRIYRGQIISQ